MADSTPENTKPEVKEVTAQPEAAKPAATPAATAPEVKGSNKLVIVIVIVVVILVLCAACGFGISYLTTNVLNKAATDISNNVINDAAKNLQNEAQQIAQGQLPGQTSSSSGTTGSNGSFSTNATLPSDVPAYPGATNEGGYTGKDDNGKDATFVTMTTKDSVDQVISFYKAQLPINGWTNVQEYNFILVGVTGSKGTKEVGVIASEDTEKKETSIIITVSDK